MLAWTQVDGTESTDGSLSCHVNEGDSFACTSVTLFARVF